jgi:hypothetical protein
MYLKIHQWIHQEWKIHGSIFSIAIPAYGYNGKGKDFLEKLTILKEQTFEDFEVVISDHSTDDTIKDLCDSWMDRLNIHYKWDR